jgi:hypothetical protein
MRLQLNDESRRVPVCLKPRRHESAKKSQAMGDVSRVILDVKARSLSPGDAVRGRVTLTLPAPTEALRMVVTLEARRRSVSTAARGPMRYRRDVVWRTEKALEGERTFRDGLSWPFELLVPEGALEPTFAVTPDEGPPRFPLEWRVVARLERPASFTLKAEVPVAVTARTRRVRRARSPRRKAPSDGAR